ncbi:SHOCT domain-containing protein [Halomarina rubra]|uniref:SHOCT domain-containing protein n=1 Tax=Halomarina rubra TaxID=2071873 RepID=A0ABD6AXB9_9EURY|nr:SHOCT domain-containing protein [Halomarina rubra]
MATTNRTDASTLLLLLLVAVLGLPMLWMTLMGAGGMMGYGGMMYGNSVGSGWWIVGVALQFLFLLLVLGGSYFVVRRLFGQTESEDSALEELRRAYARGDLSDEEYETRKDRLER